MTAGHTRNAPNDGFGLVGTTLEGKYRIDRVVAEGGFGVVYAGYHTGLKVPVAVKVLKALGHLPELERARFAEQFLGEGETIARLQHPHIVAALDVGVSAMPSGASAPWMVLEWLTGVTLADDLRERRERGEHGRAPAEALALLGPVIDAVAHAHDAGIAHRDLKPANIMLVPSRRGVVAYVLDFGIAKAMEADDDAGSGATQTSGAVQTFSPRYAAPEQVAGTRTGPWTDVHALALIMTEILTDEEPYTARSRAALYAQVLSVDRPTPGAKGVDVGPVESVLRKALAFRPDERQPTAGELLTSLEAVMDSAPTTSHSERRPIARSVSPPADGASDKPVSAATGPAVVEVPAQPATGVRRWPRALGALIGLIAIAAAGSWWMRPPSNPSHTVVAPRDALRAPALAPAPPPAIAPPTLHDSAVPLVPMADAATASTPLASDVIHAATLRQPPPRAPVRRRTAPRDAGGAATLPTAHTSDWDPG